MSLLKWSLATLAVAALTIAPALVAGSYVNRWNEPDDLSRAAALLDSFPAELGSWRQQAESPPLSEGVCRELGLAGELGRQYVDSETGQNVNLLLMVGHPGRLVRHPPYICYDNRANEQVGEIRPLEIGEGASASQFSLIEYRREADGLEEFFLVAYGFADESGVWQSPSLPRLVYGGEPSLYKMQALAVSGAESDPEAVERLKKFLTQFVKTFPAVLPSRQ